MKKTALILLSTINSILLIGCGSGDTTEGGVEQTPIVLCNSNTPNTTCELNGNPYDCVNPGDSVIKDEEGTVITMYDIDHVDTKGVCVVSGSASIIKGGN